jgi:ribose 5-phosphate isomerase A
MPETFIEDKAKEAAGKAAADLVQNGMTVGLGTGSTVAFFISRLAERCKEGLKIQTVATSTRSHELAKKLNIPLLDETTVESLDISVDGADELDKSGHMIKGGGGALLREKIVASMTKHLIIIVDEKKCVDRLGTFPLPVEISCFCYHATLKHLKSSGFDPHMRKNKDGGLFLTDNGNLIADLHFKKPIENLEKTNTELQSITGVLETGLFLNLKPTVLIGHSNGTTTTLT